MLLLLVTAAQANKAGLLAVKRSCMEGKAHSITGFGYSPDHQRPALPAEPASASVTTQQQQPHHDIRCSGDIGKSCPVLSSKRDAPYLILPLTSGGSPTASSLQTSHIVECLVSPNHDDAHRRCIRSPPLAEHL